MPDIFTNSELIERRWKTRAKKIIITNPPSDNETGLEKEIIFDVEDIPYDNNIPNYIESFQQPPLKISISNVASEIFVVFDPVTKQNITISVAGIASAIEEAFAKWQK
jgi:hypothetical protein